MKLTYKRVDQLSVTDMVFVESFNRHTEPADRLMVGATYVEDFKGGEFHTVTSLELVGDDVIVKGWDFEFTTSQGNQFLVLG